MEDRMSFPKTKEQGAPRLVLQPGRDYLLKIVDVVPPEDTRYEFDLRVENSSPYAEGFWLLGSSFQLTKSLCEALGESHRPVYAERLRGRRVKVRKVQMVKDGSQRTFWQVAEMPLPEQEQ
jgi:hypothetical protein